MMAVFIEWAGGGGGADGGDDGLLGRPGGGVTVTGGAGGTGAAEGEGGMLGTLRGGCSSAWTSFGAPCSTATSKAVLRLSSCALLHNLSIQEGEKLVRLRPLPTMQTLLLG